MVVLGREVEERGARDEAGLDTADGRGEGEAGQRQRGEAVKCRGEEWETGLNEDLALVGRVSRRRLVSHPSP